MTTPSQPPHDEDAETPTTLERADAGHGLLEEARMWNVVSYLISGPVIFGGIGWGLDVIIGTSWIVAIGVLGGMALSLYLVWFRYGTQ